MKRCVAKEAEKELKKNTPESKSESLQQKSDIAFLNLRKHGVCLGSTKYSNLPSRLTRFTGWLFVLLTLMISSAFAEIDPIMAIKAIVGEAEGESYIGKVAVAEAIRNRGHFRGVYGVNSPRLRKAPKRVWKDAEKAWKESAKSNLVKGADHWESKDFKVPSWAKGMKKTAEIGKHVFYKEVRK